MLPFSLIVPQVAPVLTAAPPAPVLPDPTTIPKHVNRAKMIQSMYGRGQSPTGAVASLMALGASQRSRFSHEPALSSVPEWRAPPNGWLPSSCIPFPPTIPPRGCGV